MNSTSQRDEATQGFESIPFIVRRYQVIERMRRSNADSIAVRQADTDALVKDLETNLVQLYSKILEYQICLMRQYSHIWALRYGRDVFKADTWTTMLSEIKDLDSTCSRLAAEIGQEELEAGMKENKVKIDTLLQQWGVGVQWLQEQGTTTHMVMEAQAREDRAWREREDFRKLLQALRAKNPYRDQMERTPTRQPGTCNWCLNNSLFQTWRNDPHSSLLWVSANPGCGKSVLSKCLIEEKLASLDPQHATICYFFFKDISPDSRSITKALSAILHQLFTKIPGLVEHAVSAFDENGDELSSMFSTMWEILEKAAADSRAGEIICVLDALDECEEAQQKTLIERLKSFYKKAEDGGVRKHKLRFLSTSRPYRNIRAQFHSLIRQFPIVHLSGDDESDLIRDEIDLVIRSEVSAIASERCFDSETEEFLLKQILNMENRTYLWLHLILDQIRNSDNAGNERAIRKEIRTIPQTVSKAYEAILGKSKDKKLASKLLHILVGAETALTLQELNVAMSIEDGSQCYRNLELESEAAFELRIKSICGLFVYTDRSKVFLIHQTAKEFLQWNQEVSEPPTGMWEHSLKPEESNSLLAGICVNLLMFDDLETNPLSAEGLDDRASTAHYEQYCDAHVLLEYAAIFWAEHLKSSPVGQQDLLLQKAADLCNVRSRRCWTWLRVKRLAEDSTQPLGFTDLILASELGLVALAKHLLSQGIDVNAMDKEGAAALNRAVENRNIDMVRILLDSGADVEAGGDWETPWREELDENGSLREVKAFSGRPLMLATKNDDHDMVQSLLASGADPDARSIDENLPGRTALHFATIMGDEPMMRVLLENGADVHARVSDCGSLQGKATRKDREELIGNKHLLKKDIPWADLLTLRVQMTALEIAVLEDDAGKVRLLLEYGADPEAEVLLDDEVQETDSCSLQSDTSEKSISIPVSPNEGQEVCDGSTDGEDVERLSTKDSDQARFYGDDVCSESSLVSKDDVESVNLPAEVLEEWERAIEAISKFTVFHLAVSRGAEDVVRLLLQYGASTKPGSATPSEPTALHLATILACGKVTGLLPDQTVNVDPKDLSGNTSLPVAVWHGYRNVFNELLEHAVDVNVKDNTGTTPLHLAAFENCHSLLRDLLGQGADPHAEDKNGNSPLLIAVLRGYDQAVKEFIRYGADLNTKNKYGFTALHVAAQHGHDLIVRELLGHGVDLNSRDSNKDTPLHIAAREGHDEVVKQLLDCDANVDARDRHKATPLFLAALEGRGHVAKQLLHHNASSSSIIIETKKGFTVLDLIIEEDEQQLVHLLRECLREFGACPQLDGGNSWFSGTNCTNC